eukprot:7470115-Karenia_brevis.AAC.1
MCEGVKLEKKYSLTRQLVFIVPEGGEKCWCLREALLEKLGDYEIKGTKDLRCRVEDHPDRADKRTHFFRALRALESQFPRESHEANNIIVDTRFCCMYAGVEHESLGQAAVEGWTWDTEVLKQAFGDR